MEQTYLPKTALRNANVPFSVVPDREDLDKDILDQEAMDTDKIDKKRKANVPGHLKLARLRRRVERGESVEPSDFDELGDIPEAGDLAEKNRQRIDSDRGGFTLSPLKLLMRG